MIEMPSVPQYVTRFYRDLDFALDVVANRQITFVHVSTLNDPFDPYFFMETDFGGSRNVLLKHIAAEHPQDLTWFKANITDDWWQDAMTALKEYYSRERSGMFVFSTCAESADFHPRDNLYMWGHYGNGHRGVAIEFDTAKLKSSLLESSTFPGESESLKDVLWTKIEYRKEIPRFPAEEYYQFIMHNQNTVSESDRTENWEPTALDRHFKLLVHIKSDVWERENEWRLMCSSPTRMKILRCRISADSIKTITMGLNSSEEAHSNFAAEAVENFPQAVVFRAKKREGFLLDFERIFHPTPTSSQQPPETPPGSP